MIIIIFMFLAILTSDAFCYTEEYAYINKNVPDISIDSLEGSFRLSEIVSKKPVLMTFIYTRCPQACYVYLNRLSEFFKKREIFYNVAVMSFDPRDSLDDMGKLRQILATNWIFGISKDIEALLREVGFEYKEVDGNYDHPFLLVALDRDLKIVRRVKDFDGIEIIPQIEKDLRGEFTPRSKFQKGGFLSCFRYDPATGDLRISWGYLLILIPPILTSLVVGVISVLSRSLHG